MAHSRIQAGNLQNEPESLVEPESKKVLKKNPHNDVGMPKERRSQMKALPMAKAEAI